MAIPLSSNGITMKDYSCSTQCTWCDGCGDYGIWTALKRALVELGIAPWQVLLCYDVGCHGNMSDKLQGYRFHGLHGRVIPFAVGAKLANPKLPVIAVGGDGASFSEGIGHLVHAVRSNYPIVFILHNNANYGLTTGQASALTPQGQTMNTSPNGIPEQTLPSMDFIFSLQPTFVARGFSGNIPELMQILTAAVRHRGFAFVDVLQVCPTYNHFATHEYFLEHCKAVGPSYVPNDRARARALAVDTTKSIATGILYQDLSAPSFYERLKSREGKKMTAVEEVQITDIAPYLDRFR